jgi:hypothetical protein
MIVVRKHFPELLPDNEEQFLRMLEGVIESVDELSSLQIDKLPNGYHFRLSPSIPSYNNSLMGEILKFNNMFGIRLDLSKSIKASGNFTFKILY